MQGRVEDARRQEAGALRKQQLMATANLWVGCVPCCSLAMGNRTLHAVPDVGCVGALCVYFIGLYSVKLCRRFFATQASTSVSFFAFTWLSGSPLTAAIAFPALAWMELVRTGLWVLPPVIQTLVQTHISFK